ncbi:tetratricopeptide repeat protein [Actinomadura sp. WMMA1423]|uniref:tetratricopeptide repeat protein n=1 Tax=Actinomadura sp. WMMA1423 TaxID=2591108 RepID=UPI0011472EB6|nr:tetratricopeptide repeat protein [Actinomadura sp. WMMA1423]
MSEYPAGSVEPYERGLAARRGGDLAGAEELLRRAFESGHPGGAHELGSIAADRGDDREAVAWWRRAAEAGLPESAFEVGYAAERSGDMEAAERWYRQAAEGGHTSGTLNLGIILENRGEAAEAMAFYRRAWELGSDKAAFNLGRLHDDDGKGDLEAAETWYTRAAERGNGGAAFNLGFVRQDRGDPAGRDEAWRRAADLGHPKAAFGLGAQSEKAGDEDAAIGWFRRSVLEAGVEQAARRLGDIYRRRGDGRSARFWTEFLSGLSGYSPEFEAFAAAGSAAAIQRQDLLNAAVGDGHIAFDVDERTLTSGGRTFHGMTFLGSFSHVSDTWLWAWANPHYGDDVPAIVPLAAVREYGERHAVPELAAGRLDLSGFPDPHQAATTMAIAAAALLGGDGVQSCRVNDGKGSFYFHLDDPALPAAGFDPLSATRLMTAAAEIFPTEQRRVVRGFLAHHGCRIRESAEVIEGTAPQGGQVTVAFTPDGLIKAASSARASAE